MVISGCLRRWRVRSGSGCSLVMRRSRRRVTAAILRSGHLARGETQEGTFAVDLSSRRVSRALDLLNGVRRGQPIGALLGYRFERSVRDTDMTLAKYILPIRQRSPLAQVSTGPDPTNEVLESIAARDVVDGIALLEAWRPNPNIYWASVPVPTSDRAALNALLEALDDALDAVSDLLVAESVHQAVLGNAERSAAALDALDRQQPIPDLGVIRTPRTATGLSHRLLVLFDGDGPAPAWTAEDPRRRADPRVDAWCGAILGDPSRFRLAAEVRDAAETVLQTVNCRLSDLGLSALSVVAASAAAGTDATELEQRLALRLRDEINPSNVELPRISGSSTTRRRAPPRAPSVCAICSSSPTRSAACSPPPAPRTPGPSCPTRNAPRPEWTLPT